MAITVEQKKDWIKKLRSGEYSQGHYVLHDYAGNYCCLGVLAEIIYGKGSWAQDGDLQANKIDLSKSACLTSYLPEYLLSKNQQAALTHMNDLDNRKFPEIADWIEANVEAV